MKESKKRRLPKPKSLDELVAFWETHDFADYWDQMEEVDAVEAAPTLKRVSVELPFTTVLGILDGLSPEDARTVYERLSKRLGPAQL